MPRRGDSCVFAPLVSATYRSTGAPHGQIVQEVPWKSIAASSRSRRTHMWSLVLRDVEMVMKQHRPVVDDGGEVAGGVKLPMTEGSHHPNKVWNCAIIRTQNRHSHPIWFALRYLNRTLYTTYCRSFIPRTGVAGTWSACLPSSSCTNVSCGMSLAPLPSLWRPPMDGATEPWPWCSTGVASCFYSV